jgi:hypothetical protein
MGVECMSERWVFSVLKGADGNNWYVVIDSKHEYNGYQTTNRELAEAFKQMVDEVVGN